jgi:lipopolysaccharide export system protein LptA
VTYADGERRARFDGGVVARSAFGTLTASRATVDLTPARVKPAERSALATTQDSRLDKIIAEGGVVLQQPERRASGERLTYTAAKDEYVMVGGPPSVVDAQRGTVTGASLTFYNHDDRVLVEGSDTSRAVTHTRVSK